MTARRGPTISRKEKLESDSRRIKAKIHEFETILMNRDHPVLEPWIKQLNLRLTRIERDLDDFDGKTEIEIRMLLNERLIVRNLLAFDDIEKALPIMRENLDKYQKELIRGDHES